MISIKKHALLCLEEVLKNKSTFDQAFELHCQDDRVLEFRDLIYEIVLGTLRVKDRLEFYYEELELKKKPKGRLWSILLCALYQLLYQNKVNSKKVIYEAVELAKIFCTKQEVAFLHFVLLNKTEALHKSHLKNHSKLKGLKRKKYLSLGNFLYTHLTKSYAPKWIEAFANESMVRPQFYLRFKKDPDSHKKCESWIQEKKIKKTKVNGAYCVLDFSILKENQSFFVQDIGFQRTLLELTEVLQKQKSNPRTVLDLCAAPGGKSFFLSNEEFQVTATDVNSDRLKKLVHFNTQLKLPLQWMDYEAFETNEHLKKFDLVVVDAPCTSSGTLRKNPEMKWNREERDLHSLVEVQKELLTKGLSWTAPNGFLFYSVCSVLKEEGEWQVNEFLKQHPSLQIIKKWDYQPKQEEHPSFLEDGHFAVLFFKLLP